MIDLNRLPNESEEMFIWRVGRAYDSGEIDLSWTEIANIINRQFRSDNESYSESVYRKAYQSARRFYEAGVFNDLSPDVYFAQLDEKRRDLQKEKIKLQTEKLEYNRWLREDARDEMLADKFVQAIKDAPPITFPNPLPHNKENSDLRSGILIGADSHFGVEFSIPGLFGDVINEYSPEIFHNRMTSLLAQTINLVNKEGLDELRVYSLGDSTDGLLRVGQLFKLRYGVVDQGIEFANYMAYWLNELSKNVRVKFQMVFGNHTELRFFNQKKGSFKDENVGKFIREIISARLHDNPNFQMIVNPSGLIFDTVQGYNILGIHGEVKSLQQALKDYSDIYNVRIDYLFAGHKHHSEYSNCGVRKGVIGVGSIMGADSFAVNNIRRTSDATASLVIFEAGRGKVDEHTFVLN